MTRPLFDELYDGELAERSAEPDEAQGVEAVASDRADELMERRAEMSLADRPMYGVGMRRGQR